MTTPYDDENDEEANEAERTPNWRRRLEAEAKAGREAVAEAAAAKAEATAARRELAMVQLGIDTGTGPGKLFAKAYDGPPEVEAMRAAATEYGVLAPPPPAVPTDQQQAMDRISSASAGGVPSGGAPHDFEAELDAIPMITSDGQWNPDYANQVLAATQVQAAREGRQFTASGGKIKLANPGPAIAPLSQ